MNKKGLLVEPKFDDLEYYLENSKLTKCGDKLDKVINEFKQIIENSDPKMSDGMIIRKIMLWMSQNIKRLSNTKDERKFKRTAEEILISRERTGCADSATLFTAIVRNLGIPTMQVITFSKEWARDFLNGKNTCIEGHYFVACYLNNIHGEGEWILIDSNRDVIEQSKVEFHKLNLEDRNINLRYYSFAYVRDYRDLSLDGITIDSINNMARIQIAALKESDITDFKIENKII